jgi:predicted metal-dependent HD superfamily phosphohydrolase
MFNETELVQNARQTAEELLKQIDNSLYCYHNINHTQFVVKNAIEIGSHSGLDKKDIETLVIAAWFHDVGYASGGAPGHEERGMEAAKIFLEENGVGKNRIEKVIGCIKATQMPQNPQNILEEVLCDADLANLGSEEFMIFSENLRKEFIHLKNKNLSDNEWCQEGVGFLKNHQYFTEYGKQHLQPLQDKNLKKLEKRISKEWQKENKKTEELENEIEKLKKKLEDEKNKPGRGIETLFRTTSSNHMELSSIADNKANIMISVNSIIVSLLVSVLFRKFEEYPNLIVPTAILTVSCLLTIIFAILATRPNVTSGVFSRDDIASKKTNLLFFGNFHRMSLDDYEWGMNEVIKDNNLLYSSMIHDIYFAGKVLGKKYRFIRTSYTIFMFGFVISVISYAIALIYFPVE